MKGVVQSVYSVQTVPQIKHVLETNVKILVLACAELMHNVQHSITCHNVPVCQASQEIHSNNVSYETNLLQNQLLSILVYHHHVVQIAVVERLMEWLCVHVTLNSLVLLQIAVQNALLTPNVPVTKRVTDSNVLTRVKEPVDFRQIVKLTIITQFAVVQTDLKEIHS